MKLTAKTEIQRDIDHKVRQTIAAARSLIEDMQLLVNKLESRGADASFNSLGEAAPNAKEVDRLLAEITAQKQCLEVIEAFEKGD